MSIVSRSKRAIRESFERLSNAYITAGYPLLPLTRLLRQPLRWYFHRQRTLRHDHRKYWRPRLLSLLHRLLVVDYPSDFLIYRRQLKFRSYGSEMALHAYYVGEIEYHLVQYVISQLRPGFVLFDVGAHHGAYTLIVAFELKKRGWPGVVHSFEPDSRNFELLEYNVRQNQLMDYVVLHRSAVANYDGVADLIAYADENSANTLAANSEFIDVTMSTLAPARVPVVMLDSLLEQVRRVHMIKMDIQGAEPLALNGGRQLIERDRPTIVVEAVPEFTASQEVRSFLNAHHYTICGVTEDGQLCRPGSSDVFVSWDWVALPLDA